MHMLLLIQTQGRFMFYIVLNYLNLNTPKLRIGVQ